MQQQPQQNIMIKAQCTIFRNSLQINCKKKSKLSNINLDEKGMVLIITGKGDNQQFKFPLQKLKTIHKKFIDEGRITIEFDSQLGVAASGAKTTDSANLTSTIYKGIQKSNQNIQNDGSFQIFISNACKQNLHYLINQIVNLRKKLSQMKQKSMTKQKLSLTQKQLQKQKKDHLTQKNKKRPAQQIKYQQPERSRPKLTRKQMFQLFSQQQTKKVAVNKQSRQSIQKIMQNEKNFLRITFQKLPKILLREILQFSGISLSQRLISKQFQQLTLKNVRFIKFKDQVDQQTFNKLAKWALNVQASLKMKNVKALKLQDRYDDQQLIKNRAKSLYFSNWKQITSKVISQLKGLRIYSLELPYTIKFQLSNIFGIRLVQLRLKGNGVDCRNPMVSDENLLYIINNVRELRAIEVAYASSKVLCQIKDTSKFHEIRIGTLNKIAGYEDWTNFKKFSNLRILSIQDIQKNGSSFEAGSIVHDCTYPQCLTTLQIGYNISCQTKHQIPQSIKQLKLLGQHFRNRDLDPAQLYLPLLQVLDIIECPSITPECLQYLQHMNDKLRILTNWNKNQVEYAQGFYRGRMCGFEIVTVRGFSYC